MATLVAAAILLAAAASASAYEEHSFCTGKNLSGEEACGTANWYIHSAYANGTSAPICLMGPEQVGSGCMHAANEGIFIGASEPYGYYGRANIIHTINQPPTKVYGTFWTGPAAPSGGGGGGGESPPPSPSWHYLNFGGTLTSDPDICSWGTSTGGHIEINARGTDNALWHRYWNGANWSNWESMGGTLASAPGCVSWGSNRVDVVARATNNTVQHWYWNGSSWQTDNLGGNIIGDPDIASWGSNHLDVVARTTDGSIVKRTWNGTSWGSWETVAPANTVASGAGVSADGSGGNRLDIVARAPNGSVIHYYEIGGVWGSENFGGVIQGDPDFSSWGPGNYDVWVRDMNNQLEHRWWNGSSWSGWELAGAPGLIYSSPSAVAVNAGRIDVAGLNSDSSLGYWYWE